jgi:hypothetical protein
MMNIKYIRNVVCRWSPMVHPGQPIGLFINLFSGADNDYYRASARQRSTDWNPLGCFQGLMSGFRRPSVWQGFRRMITQDAAETIPTSDIAFHASKIAEQNGMITVIILPITQENDYHI